MTNHKQKLVLVFGTFDYLHAGHEFYFKEARKLGSEVMAVVARDKTTKSIKGENPDHSEKERLKNLKNTGWVDKAILGDNKDKMKCIKIYRPDVIALGYDQFAFTYGLKKLIMDLKINTEIVRIKAYQPNMYKSSIIRSQNIKISTEDGQEKIVEEA